MENKIINNYLRDLQCRQNRCITSAQIHLFENAKRYTNKDIQEVINIIKKQIDLNGNLVDEKIDDSFGTPTKIIEQKHELEKESTSIETTKEIFNTKLLSVDMEANVRLSYQKGLLEELITSFTKLYNWMLNGGRILKFTSDGKYVIIEPEEINITIQFIDKLNRLPKDEKSEH